MLKEVLRRELVICPSPSHVNGVDYCLTFTLFEADGTIVFDAPYSSTPTCGSPLWSDGGLEISYCHIRNIFPVSTFLTKPHCPEKMPFMGKIPFQQSGRRDIVKGDRGGVI